MPKRENDSKKTTVLLSFLFQWVEVEAVAGASAKRKKHRLSVLFLCLECFLFTISIHGGRIVPLRMQTPSASDAIRVSQFGGLVKMSQILSVTEINPKRGWQCGLSMLLP